MVYEKACADLRDRMIALVDNPPYRFRNTTRAEAEAYQARRKDYRGNTPNEIDDAESSLGIRFPSALRTYFAMMGETAGDLFRGSERARLSDLREHRADADELLEDCSADRLPAEAVVFLFHQGYTFSYQLGAVTTSGKPAPEDGPVYIYVEGDDAPRQAAPSLLAYFEAQVAQHENVARGFREQGGYYLTVSGRQVREQFPALSERPRPLETADQFID